MIHVNLRRSRQVFGTLCCVAILGMIAVSLSIMDAGAGREVGRLSGSSTTGDRCTGRASLPSAAQCRAPVIYWR